MQREILIAMIAGIAIGLLITFGVWRVNTSIKSQTPGSETANTASSNKNTENSNAGTPNSRISFANIENNQIFTESPIRVSGITKPQSKIVISAEDKDYILNADDKGAFEEDIDLTGGINKLIFSAVDDSNQYSETTLTLIYSTEFSKDLE